MVASIASAANAAYYFEYLAAEQGGFWWHGEGAKAFGYEGEVRKELLKLAFQGRDADGKQLVQAQRGKTRQEGWDITFSPPKDFSVLWSVLDADGRAKLEGVLKRAAATGVDYLQENALWTRRGKGGHTLEKANGVFAMAMHGTSRAQDPQLHVHCLFVNLCQRADGTTGTIRSEDLYAHKMAAGAIFRVELAYLLATELGIEAEQEGFAFSLPGVPRSLSEAQSKRRELIESIAAEEGWSSAAAMAHLTLTSRDGKGEASLELLRPHWKEEGKKHGLTEERAKALFGRARHIEHGVDAKLETAAKQFAIRDAVRLIAKCEAYFPERDILRHAATLMQGKGVSAKEVIAEARSMLDGFEYRVGVEGNPYRHYSTKENVLAEQELIRRAEEGKEAKTHVISEAALEKATAKVERQLTRERGVETKLTEDQVRSLRFATLEPGSIKPIQGFAGTGKTKLLLAARLAWESSGFRVVGTSLSGKAALGLEEDTGIKSFTTEKLLTSVNPKLRETTARERVGLLGNRLVETINAHYYAEKRASAALHHPFRTAAKLAAKSVAHSLTGEHRPKRVVPKLDAKTIVVVDEAAMLGTRAMLTLKRECDKAGAKLVVVGDRLQLPPIEAGGPFWSLATRLGYESLTTIVRQEKDWMKDALMSVIEGEPKKALEKYAEQGELQVEASRKAAIDALVRDYRTLKSKEIPRSLVLTSTNAEAKLVNERIQGRRRTSLELGHASVRLATGERAYRGDRVMFTLNDYGNDVRNGMLGTVVKAEPGILRPGKLTISVDGKGRGLLRRPKLVTVDLAKYSDVRLGYAVTTHKAQGATVDRSFVLAGESMLDREMGFVQLSRAKRKTTVYSSELEAGKGLAELAQKLKRSRAKDLAHDHELLRQREADLALTL